jgi:hypothetical protein
MTAAIAHFYRTGHDVFRFPALEVELRLDDELRSRLKAKFELRDLSMRTC